MTVLCRKKLIGISCRLQSVSPHCRRKISRPTGRATPPKPALITTCNLLRPGGATFQPKFLVNEPGAYTGITIKGSTTTFLLYGQSCETATQFAPGCVLREAAPMARR